MAPSAAEDLELLLSLAEPAGEIALRHFGTDLEIAEKPDDQGPVTAADREIDRFLQDSLLGKRPDYGWLSEETPDDPARSERARVFIVDPIDGTRGFIEGKKGFSVVMAVAEAGRVVAAVVHLPARAETYAAAQSMGAELNGAPLTPMRRTDLSGADFLINTSQLSPRHWPGGVPPVNRHFRPSFAWRLCLVAAGAFDGLVTFRDAWEWDIGAGCLIAQEAGAAVSDATGQPIRFNTADRTSPGVIAAAPAIHRQLLALRKRPLVAGEGRH
ncbi:MAG: 3'(2'),5'-bisphosphate nucleotidase CysQ [Pseudomonadota bacterium]